MSEYLNQRIDAIERRQEHQSARLTALERGEGKADGQHWTAGAANEILAAIGGLCVHDIAQIIRKHAPPAPAVVVTAEDLIAAIREHFPSGNVSTWIGHEMEKTASALTALLRAKAKQ